MFLPTSLPYYTLENTDILNKLRTAYPDKQINCILQNQYFIVCISNGGRIYFKFYSIVFYNMSPDIIKFVLDHTGCNYYIIFDNDDKILNIVTPNYNNDVYVIPILACGLTYNIHSTDYTHIGSFSRMKKLTLTYWVGNIDILISTLKNINETVIFHNIYRSFSDEIRPLFDENFLWIPPKRESPCFHP